ncbi:MAG: FmdB family zinc ribbon protein [Candidatus Omnitrophota bacterium]
MPTYEYECSQCGKFEQSQSMNDEPLKKCPKCGKKVKKLISSGGGLIFKGSGFYATDYRKPAKSGNAPASCPNAAKGCNGCSH